MGNSGRTLIEHTEVSLNATDNHTCGTGETSKYSSGISLCFL